MVYYWCECLQPLGWKMFVRRLYYIKNARFRLTCADSNVHVHALIDNAGNWKASSTTAFEVFSLLIVSLLLFTTTYFQVAWKFVEEIDLLCTVETFLSSETPCIFDLLKFEFDQTVIWCPRPILSKKSPGSTQVCYPCFAPIECNTTHLFVTMILQMIFLIFVSNFHCNVHVYSDWQIQFDCRNSRRAANKFTSSECELNKQQYV